jgi:hypothetical protein
MLKAYRTEAALPAHRRDAHPSIDPQAKESNMSELSKDIGVLTALAQRLQNTRLPMVLEMKERVERGEVLDDHDLDFLEKVFSEVGEIKPFLDRNPQYQDIASRMTQLYKEITTKALANESAQKR